jgi:hypothetical protein
LKKNDISISSLIYKRNTFPMNRYITKDMVEFIPTSIWVFIVRNIALYMDIVFIDTNKQRCVDNAKKKLSSIFNKIDECNLSKKYLQCYVNPYIYRVCLLHLDKKKSPSSDIVLADIFDGPNYHQSTCFSPTRELCNIIAQKWYNETLIKHNIFR